MFAFFVLWVWVLTIHWSNAKLINNIIEGKKLSVRELDDHDYKFKWNMLFMFCYAQFDRPSKHSPISILLWMIISSKGENPKKTLANCHTCIDATAFEAKQLTYLLSCSCENRLILCLLVSTFDVLSVDLPWDCLFNIANANDYQ